MSITFKSGIHISRIERRQIACLLAVNTDRRLKLITVANVGVKTKAGQNVILVLIVYQFL